MSGIPCPLDPKLCTIDAETGEHVNISGLRTLRHAEPEVFVGPDGPECWRDNVQNEDVFHGMYSRDCKRCHTIPAATDSPYCDLCEADINKGA